MTTFEKELHLSGHVTKVSVRPCENEGWELRVEEDSRLVRTARYTDWHRVERAITSLALDEGVLTDAADWSDAGRAERYSTKR